MSILDSLNYYGNRARKATEYQAYLARQALAGVIENTVANSSEQKGYYRPAILDAPGAMIGVVGALVNRRKDGKPFAGDNPVESYANNALRRSGVASDRTNATLRVSAPQNTAELAARIIPTVLLPGPKGSTIARAMSRVPGGTKVVNAATRIAAATPKVVRVAVRAAGEAVTPFNTSPVKIAAPVGAVMTGVMDTVMDQSVDPTTGTRYQGTIPKLIGMDTTVDTPETKDGDEKVLDDFVANVGTELGDVDAEYEQQHVDEVAAQPISDDDLDIHDEEEKLNGYEKAAVAIGAVFAGGAAIKYSRDFIAARRAAAVAEENLPSFTGKKYRNSQQTATGKAVTAIAQHDQPIRDMAEQFLGRPYAKQWGYRSDRMTNVSIGARTRHLFQTGEMPSTNRRTVKLAPLAEAYAKELDPKEQRLVSDALLAASSLDDYRATGVASSLTRDAQGNPVTPTQLERLVNQVRNHPKYGKYFEGIQKSYDDLAKFRVLRGRDTWEGYRELRARRPNYVAMNRNLERDMTMQQPERRYDANADQGLGASRTELEGAGVQGVTGAGNPFVALFDEWANEVRRSDLNDLRADFLINMDAAQAFNKDGMRIVESVSPNAASNADDIHVVRVQGKQMAFKVRDPGVDAALRFAPRASIKILEGMRQLKQSTTTGALASIFNGFAALKTPIYDTTIGMLNRPKGVALGQINEALGTNLPDPTAVVSAYTGAARYLFDDMRGGIATAMRDAVIREHSWMKGLIGERNLDNLATWFENSYENSIKADLDRKGITSITMHGSPDASELASGVEHVAPHFADAMGNMQIQDLGKGWKEGKISALKYATETANSAYIKGKSNMIVRAYTNVLEALHNGFTYSAHATNKGRIKNLDKHISDMRRLSVDASQHGASDILNKGMGMIPYANLGVQSLYQLALRAKQDGLPHLLFNMGATLGTAAALHYIALGTDPAAVEAHMKKTPQQKAVSLTTFGGVDMPLDPVARLFTSFLFPIYDKMSGLSDGNYNPNFFAVMDSWLHNDHPQMDEKATKDWEAEIGQALYDNNPFQLTSIPLVELGLAHYGVDTGASRMTGELQTERVQNLTGLEDDTRRPDALATAHTENMLAALFSTVGRTLYSITDDMYRAYGQKPDMVTALDQGLQRWKDGAAKSSGPARRMLFGQYETVESIADENFQLMKDRDKGIEQALKLYQKDVRTDGITSTFTPRYSRFLPTEEDVIRPDVQGTEAEYIASMARQLETLYLSKNRKILAGLGAQTEAYGAQYLTRVEDRNKNINAVNDERKYQHLMMLNSVREYEELISHRIGKPFRFDDFNPKDHLNPLPPSN